MLSKILVQISNQSGSKVFRVQPAIRPFTIPIDNFHAVSRPVILTPPTPVYIQNLSAYAIVPPQVSSNFLLSKIAARYPVQSLPTSSIYVPKALSLQNALKKETISHEPYRNQKTEENRLQIPLSEGITYTHKLIRDRIKSVLKQNGITDAYVEPIFDALYNGRLDRLYREVYNKPYPGKQTTSGQPDRRILNDMGQVFRSFESFAASQLYDRGKSWQPQTVLDRKMSGEWFVDYMDRNIESIIDQGNLTKMQSRETNEVDTDKANHCPHVPNLLKQAYLSTPNIDKFNSKAFEGLPALFELPRWDIERSSGLEPRLNKLEVDCETMLSYDYPAVLAHRIKMLKAEGGAAEDIRILEDLKNNIDAVLLEERYLNSSVWEANNTARYLALEGEEGLRRAYKNSVSNFVENLTQKPAVREQAEYLGLHDSMVKNYFTLVNNPHYKAKLVEAMTGYVMEKNSNLPGISGDQPAASPPKEDTGYLGRILDQVVNSFGTEKH